MKKLKLILLRHAARTPTFFGDEVLNSSGRQQAEKFAQIFSAKDANPPAVLAPSQLLVSPKKRAIQTLQPLSAATGIELQIDPRLDERLKSETGAAFETRIKAVLAEVAGQAGGGETIFICSHLDWLEAAMALLPAVLTEREISAPWSTCEYRVFRFENELWAAAGGGVVHAES